MSFLQWLSFLRFIFLIFSLSHFLTFSRSHFLSTSIQSYLPIVDSNISVYYFQISTLSFSIAFFLFSSHIFFFISAFLLFFLSLFLVKSFCVCLSRLISPSFSLVPFLAFDLYFSFCNSSIYSFSFSLFFAFLSFSIGLCAWVIKKIFS